MLIPWWWYYWTYIFNPVVVAGPTSLFWIAEALNVATLRTETVTLPTFAKETLQ